MPDQLAILDPPSEMERLRETLGVDFPSIDCARAKAREFRQRLEFSLSGLTSDDTSIVLFGSLARDEFTSGSDVDWTLLIDGLANPNHLDLATKIADVLKDIGARGPGQEGIFGNLAFSHDIVHQIGGQDDTNSNTTRRILLLLESRSIGRPDAYGRVFNHVLSRYIEEDAAFWKGRPSFTYRDFC